MDDYYWDSFDCEEQCEEYYEYHKPEKYEDLDWLDAHEDFDFPFPIEI